MLGGIQMRDITIYGRDYSPLKVPVLYSTKNLVLHRDYNNLTEDISTKKREYTLTWFNDKGDTLRF